jgi:hypothetical protein
MVFSRFLPCFIHLFCFQVPGGDLHDGTMQTQEARNISFYARIFGCPGKRTLLCTRIEKFWRIVENVKNCGKWVVDKIEEFLRNSMVLNNCMIFTVYNCTVLNISQLCGLTILQLYGFDHFTIVRFEHFIIVWFWKFHNCIVLTISLLYGFEHFTIVWFWTFHNCMVFETF